MNKEFEKYILDSIIGQRNKQFTNTDLRQRINLNLDLESVDTIIYILSKYINGDFE